MNAKRSSRQLSSRKPASATGRRAAPASRRSGTAQGTKSASATKGAKPTKPTKPTKSARASVARPPAKSVAKAASRTSKPAPTPPPSARAKPVAARPVAAKPVSPRSSSRAAPALTQAAPLPARNVARLVCAKPPAPLPAKQAPRPTAPAPAFDASVDEGLNPGFFPIDEVMDETDQAQHLQLQEQAAISARARELNRPETHPDFDGLTCVECGDEIPQARLLLHKVRCFECQGALELADARARRTYG